MHKVQFPLRISRDCLVLEKLGHKYIFVRSVKPLIKVNKLFGLKRPRLFLVYKHLVLFINKVVSFEQ